MFEIFHNKKLIQKERERIKGENLDPTAINNSLRNCTALKKGEMEWFLEEERNVLKTWSPPPDCPFPGPRLSAPRTAPRAALPLWAWGRRCSFDLSKPLSNCTQSYSRKVDQKDKEHENTAQRMRWPQGHSGSGKQWWSGRGEVSRASWRRRPWNSAGEEKAGHAGREEMWAEAEGKPFHRTAPNSCWKGLRMTLCCVATGCFLWPGWRTPGFLDGAWAYSCGRDASARAAPGLPLHLAPTPPPLPSPPATHNAENIPDMGDPTRLLVPWASRGPGLP